MSRIAEILVGLALAASLLTTNDVSARAACPIRLDAVEAVAPDLVWIGGTGCGRALIEAWDGTGWQMSWMGPQSGGSIRAIAANTAHEAWAVGEQWSARLDHYVPAIVTGTGMRGIGSRRPGGARRPRSTTSMFAATRSGPSAKDRTQRRW